MIVAMPKFQSNHNFINQAIGQWLDIHYGDNSFNGRVFIGHRKNGGGVYTMSARSLNELRPYVLMIHASQRLDYYITANTVSGINRNIDGLFGLQNIVVDIDCHEDGADTVELVQTLIWRCQRDLWSTEDLPRPNSVVRTGRGVQLWWAIKPCHASCRYYYDQIKTGIMDRIEVMISEYSELDGLQVDRAASSNPVGYYRLPLTYNTAAGRYGTLQVLHSERYDTHELAGYISPLPADEMPQGLPSESSEPVPMEQGDLIVLHNLYTTGANRVAQLVKLRALRNKNIGEETRNNLCFAMYNALRMGNDHEDAMERLWAFNAGFRKPMTEQELEATICTAKRKGGYRYTNAKLIELLDITQKEQDTIGLHPFNGTYKPWSHAKPNATRDAVRKTRREGRDAKIIAMHQDGISQAETARQMGISRNTVAKVVKKWCAEMETEDLTTTDTELLKNGSTYDCLLYSPVTQEDVSAEEGHSYFTQENVGLFVLPGKPGAPPGG